MNLRTLFFISISFVWSIHTNAQQKPLQHQQIAFRLLDSLWENPTSFFNINDKNWRELCDNLHHIDLNQLNKLSNAVFYGKDAKIINHTESSEGVLGAMNRRSHRKKMKAFSKQMRQGFRDRGLHPDNKVVLMEGDSWFEYPLLLNDIADNLMDNKHLAVYSLAAAGDWVSNMIATHQYQFEYLKLNPEVFIISGGGNDILQDNRLASFVKRNPIEKNNRFLKNYRQYVVLRSNSKPVTLCKSAYCPPDYHQYDRVMPELTRNTDPYVLKHVVNGRRYLNKRFYRWLVSLKLEYKILFESLKKLDEAHFNSLMIITQGYDYPTPSFKERFGKSMLQKNGVWLKEPLMMKGITDPQTQSDIVMAMIFDFNEMIIELGKEFPNIYHIDSRGFTRYMEQKDRKKEGSYWFDELHPKSTIYKEIAQTYIALIFNRFKHPHKVVNVIDFHKFKGEY